MRRLVLLPLLCLLLAPPARAATTLGDTSTPPDTDIPTGYLVGQATGGSGKGYAVPRAGFLTSVSAYAGTTGGDQKARVLVLRPVPGAPSGFEVVHSVEVVVPGGTPSLVSVKTHLPVQANDTLGMYLNDKTGLGAVSAPGGVVGATPSGAYPPADGTTFVPTESEGDVNVSISASFEDDADGDGFADNTEDSCPADPFVHAGPCLTDLRVSATATPAALTTGAASTVVATVAGTGAAARGATATLSLPPGLEVLAASTTGGGCGGVICDLGEVPAGGNRKVYLVVRGASAGTHGIGVSASSVTAEAAPDDNAAGTTVTVTDPPAVEPPVVPPTVSLCTVPKLKGKTKAKARKALAQAGCATGKVRGRKGRVRTQSIPARTKVLAGTKVGFRVRRR